ncbi:MAG: polysaccharide biosynthesis C-terminal domain-containing protein [Lewinellaceae bacterium]|nr:polysaccharide biosynthesis C-terminal domain-containing protein [Lewinellaceae bacterium]HPR00129.1 polysaccharide biosynthesis C-terminal domain-containing protein [Saprospiraceae bacterium]HQU54691.1 polysaccharide biosynthesis C-terminal domain-containing protein [Saprospiraceae bacterium]
MGVIQRQGAKQTLINLIAAGIGGISTIFIYPLDFEVYGIISFVQATAFLFSPFILLGAQNLTVRYFPQFKGQESRHSFLTLLLLFALAGTILFLVLAYFFYPWYENYMAGKKDDLFIRALPFFIPTAIFYSLGTMMTQYISNFHRIAVPGMINNLHKLFYPLIVLLFYFKIITVVGAGYLIAVNYFLTLLLLVLYLSRLGELKFSTDFSFLDRPLFQDMATFAFYGVFGSLSGLLMSRIDTFMIGNIIRDDSLNGISSNANYLAFVIQIPSAALGAIAGPILAVAMKSGRMDEVEQIYKKSSINLFAIGLLFFLLIWSCIDDIFQIMPNSEKAALGKYVVLFVAISRLVDMLTSVNTHIISYSKYFRFNFYTIVLLSILNIGFNLIFIPKYAIVGAALSTCLSITLYNLIKLIYIRYRFQMQPFSSGLIKVLVIGVVGYLIGYFFPDTGIPILNIFLKCALIGILYGFAIMKWKVSQDLTSLFYQGLDWVRHPSKLFR